MDMELNKLTPRQALIYDALIPPACRCVAKSWRGGRALASGT